MLSRRLFLASFVSAASASASPSYPITLPSLIRRVEPEYTEEALCQKISGVVVIAFVVNANGRAEKMRVIRSLGYGLDESALEAVAQWTLKPGMKRGKPIPISCTAELEFRLPA